MKFRKIRTDARNVKIYLLSFGFGLRKVDADENTLKLQKLFIIFEFLLNRVKCIVYE